MHPGTQRFATVQILTARARARSDAPELRCGVCGRRMRPGERGPCGACRTHKKERHLVIERRRHEPKTRSGLLAAVLAVFAAVVLALLVDATAFDPQQAMKGTAETTARVEECRRLAEIGHPCPMAVGMDLPDEG